MKNKFDVRRRETTRRLILSVSAAMCFTILMTIASGQEQSNTRTIAGKSAKPELIVQTGHSYQVNAVAFSPDGKILASGSTDSTIKLWQISTRGELRTLVGHTDEVFSVAFAPDGKTLASGSKDKTIKIWNPATGKVLKTLAGADSAVSLLAFSPDGALLATEGSGDKTISLWNVKSGQIIKVLPGHKQFLRSLAFSPDGKILASGSVDMSVKLWNVATGQLVKNLTGHKNSVLSVAFSPDGKTLASGSMDGNIKFWNVASGQETRTLQRHENDVQTVAFAADGKTLASSGTDSTIRIWSVEAGKELRIIKSENGFSAMALSPDGATLASGSLLTDKGVSLWNASDGTEIASLNGSGIAVNDVVISSDGRTLANGGMGQIAIWSLFDKGQETQRFETDGESVALSPDAKVLASVSIAHEIKLWNVAAGSERQNIAKSEDGFGSRVAFSPDGKTLAGFKNDEVVLWNVETGEVKRTFGQIEQTVRGITFSPDGKLLASSQADGKIILWNVETGQPINTLVADEDFSPYVVIFSPDGKTLASADGGEQKTITLWNVETGARKTLVGHKDYLKSLAFSPDGKILASGGDEIIKLWNIAAGRELKSFKAHNGVISALVFIPNTPYFLSGSSDSTMKIWRADRDLPVATMISLGQKEWIVVTPDGRFDTNKSLDRIAGLHWVVPDRPFETLPLEAFMRQYYEPGLLRRILKCDQEKNCQQEFKSLPSIAEINRVQPKFVIREIKSVASAADLVDVTIDIENVSESVSVGAAETSKNKQIVSGAYDLRLFRDGQLIGSSPTRALLEQYIGDAPRLIEKDKAAGTLINTEEDQAWRAANDLSKVVKFENGKAVYTFKNIQLPKDGRGEIEFSAYGFNADRVKSDTVRRTYAIEKPETRLGKTYLVTIGVNASENPAYNLRYAVNDALKMQEILGARLKAENQTLIQIPLVSDYDQNGKLTENSATKPIIKGVLGLLSGNAAEVDKDVLERIEKIAKIAPIQPEDTLIVTFSGHGYADQSGIFYLLPFDIGQNTSRLTPDILRKLISSDELSLWLRDATAKEMLLIVDACHSAAAVQGDGFKPGPMGSRGLGQLAYDKGMKILSATQADNVALELGSLQQGLLSFALLEDGINSAKADGEPADKKLFAKEWLDYGVKRVPELYQEMIDGKREVKIGDKSLNLKSLDAKARAELVCASGSCGAKRESLTQQPALFDFRRNRAEEHLMNLP